MGEPIGMLKSLFSIRLRAIQEMRLGDRRGIWKRDHSMAVNEKAFFGM
jgi:hypothetical protein